jgi:hypothetical protein
MSLRPCLVVGSLRMDVVVIEVLLITKEHVRGRADGWQRDLQPK